MIRAARRLIHARLEGHQPSARRPRARRPVAEALESRMVLATFFVTNTGDNLLPGSLRYAITQADLPGNEGSTVEITPQVTGPTINLSLGELAISDSMTIRNDSGQPLEIHQSTPEARVFHFGSAGATDLTIDGVSAGSALTIDGGSANGGDGGGIAADNPQSTLVLDYVDVLGNTATAIGTDGGHGGGIASAGAVTLNHSVVGTLLSPNTATAAGGGVYAGGALTLSSSTIEGNSAPVGGGAAVVDGDATLSAGSAISGNQAPQGLAGGLSVTTGNVTVQGGSQVNANTAKDVAGIMVGRGDVSILGGSSVSNNVSYGGSPPDPSTGDFGGGGIAVMKGSVAVDDSRVDNNQTVGMYSGGIVILLGDVTVTDGGQVDGNTNHGPGGGIAANFGGTVTVSGGSQVDGNTGAAIGGGIVNFSGPNGAVAVSGGSQVDHNVLTNRETVGGAVGVFLETIVSSLGQVAAAMPDPTGGVLAGTVQQIQQAASPVLSAVEALVHVADARGVVVAGGGIGTLLTCPISVTGGSEVGGNTAGQVALGGSRRVLGLGGGIFSALSPIDVEQSTIDANTALATGGPASQGGGLDSIFGTITLDGATISGNSASGDGGGLWDGGGLTAIGATVSGNTAGGQGGGLYVASGASAVAANSTFQGNRAAIGGGIANHGTLALEGCTVTQNTATTRGGGIEEDGPTILINTTVTGNTGGDISKHHG
jgi:fibronectin-binding autotransporter adhesin